MRALIQRVTRASVSVRDEVVACMQVPGLVALVAATTLDTEKDIAWTARKIAELRLLREEQAVSEAHAPVLVVSQFTLFADIRKGRRPSWHGAAPAEVAQPKVEAVVADLRGRGLEVLTGVFGAEMAVELVNDGPYTIWLDSSQQ